MGTSLDESELPASGPGLFTLKEAAHCSAIVLHAEWPLGQNRRTQTVCSTPQVESHAFRLLATTAEVQGKSQARRSTKQNDLNFVWVSSPYSPAQVRRHFAEFRPPAARWRSMSSINSTKPMTLHPRGAPHIASLSTCHGRQQTVPHSKASKSTGKTIRLFLFLDEYFQISRH